MLKGLIKCIGTGEKAHAWNQNWIPHDHMIWHTTHLKRDPSIHVSDFIEAGSMSWNRTKWNIGSYQWILKEFTNFV
jgi:hypothetical protein